MNNRVQKYGERIPQVMRNLISQRYHTVTRAINSEFWNSLSDTLHSIYVGSYGRNTAINTSDIDILIELPSSYFLEVDGNLQIQKLSKKLWLKKIEIVMVYYMILVDIFATLEIIILQVTNCLVLLLIVLFTTQLEIGDG